MTNTKLTYQDKIRQLFREALHMVGNVRGDIKEYMTKKADRAFQLSESLYDKDSKEVHARLAIEILMFVSMI